MVILDSVFLILGYVLMHAAYSTHDLEKEELLIPFALVESEGKRQVLRFENETQEQAIAEAKQKLEGLKESSDIWAFARESLMRENDGTATDVFSIEAWQKDNSFHVYVLMPFKPNNGKGEFQILSGIVIAIDGDEVEDEEKLKEYTQIIAEGIGMHPKAELWSGWQKW